MYQRTLNKALLKISQNFPVLLLTGPRQVGKTTLLQSCSEKEEKGRVYITLDDVEMRTLAKEEPSLFIKSYPPPLIIDEIQYAPELLSYIKIAIDQSQENGMYWLTGSQKFHLMDGIQESLAGRVAVLDLLGLSQQELYYQGTLSQPFSPSSIWIEEAATKYRNTQLQNAPNSSETLQKVYEQIWLGSFPRVHNQDPSVRDIFYKSYIQTYIQRDIRDILNINNENTFYKFLGAVAARTGQLLNYADLARDVDVDNKTVKSWLSALETSGLVYLLRPYYNNRTKRLVKAPKLYFLDTGLCTYLTKWTTAESLEIGAMSGAILETYILGEILKSYWHNGIESHFYYYRDSNQKEIDLLIETGDTLYPLEFKKTASPSKKASKNFHLAEGLGKELGMGGVVCLVDKHIPLSQTVMAIPVAYL
jgi:predicted AAA+ superfamily ATPase